MTDEAKVKQLFFIDSNIWFYAFNCQQDPVKHQVARTLVRSSDIWISNQVINEVCRNLIRKAAFSEIQISRLISSFYRRCQVVEFNCDLLLQASRLRQEHKFSFWDSLIVTSALQSGSSILYSEDMQAGLVISKQLEIVNPFQ